MFNPYIGQHSYATNTCFFVQVSVTSYKLQNYFIAPFSRIYVGIYCLPLDVETMGEHRYPKPQTRHKPHQWINYHSVWAYYCVLTYPMIRDLEPIFFPHVGWGMSGEASHPFRGSGMGTMSCQRSFVIRGNNKQWHLLHTYTCVKPLGLANASGGSYRTLATTLFLLSSLFPSFVLLGTNGHTRQRQYHKLTGPLRRFWLSFEDQAFSLEDGVLVALVPSLCRTWATPLEISDFPQGHGIALASMWHTSNYPNLEALGLGERVPGGQNVRFHVQI